MDLAILGAGGGIGSLLRWWLGKAIERFNPTPFRYGTFIVNVTGAFMLAYLTVAYGITWHERPENLLPVFLFAGGALGGYTTFSTMELEAVQMTENGRPGLAFAYLITSIGVGLLAAGAGASLALHQG